MSGVIKVNNMGDTNAIMEEFRNELTKLKLGLRERDERHNREMLERDEKHNREMMERDERHNREMMELNKKLLERDAKYNRDIYELRHENAKLTEKLEALSDIFRMSLCRKCGCPT